VETDELNWDLERLGAVYCNESGRIGRDFQGAGDMGKCKELVQGTSHKVTIRFVKK